MKAIETQATLIWHFDAKLENEAIRLSIMESLKALFSGNSCPDKCIQDAPMGFTIVEMKIKESFIVGPRE